MWSVKSFLSKVFIISCDHNFDYSIFKYPLHQINCMFKILIVIAAFFTSGVLLVHKFYAENDHIAYSSFKLNADPAANYKNYCSSCHGELMEAFVDRKWKYGSDKKSLIHAINIGYPNDGMPGFDTAFTDKEAEELADYILEGLKNVQRFHFAKQ